MPTPFRKPRHRSAAKPPEHSRSRTVLIAVSGLSPAVLTETIWALAHETPAVIPDQVIVLTTQRGRDEIINQLFGEDEVWLQLRRALLGADHAIDTRLDFDRTPDRVKVIHRRDGVRRVPLVDLATQQDNKAIADELVDELWTHTSKPDTRVIASLAGGYKTMSALCLSAMQLLAAPGDRVTHVLVGGGFEQAKPRFYFPEQAAQNLVGPDGPLCAADAARLIQLIDVPVIPLRNWFEQLLHTKPPSYDVLVSQGAAALRSAQTADLKLEIGPIAPAGRTRHHVLINGERLELTPNRYAYLRFFEERAHAGMPPLEQAIDAVEELGDWLTKARAQEPRFHSMSESVNSGSFTGEDLGKRLYDLREFLAKTCEAGRRLVPLLPVKGSWSLQLPRQAITLT